MPISGLIEWQIKVFCRKKEKLVLGAVAGRKLKLITFIAKRRFWTHTHTPAPNHTNKWQKLRSEKLMFCELWTSTHSALVLPNREVFGRKEKVFHKTYRLQFAQIIYYSQFSIWIRLCCCKLEIDGNRNRINHSRKCRVRIVRVICLSDIDV